MKAKTRNAARTRGKLLKVATRLFSKKGFDGVSVDEIVDTAKVNKRMVYHYFGNKEGIYASVLKEAFQKLAEVEKEIVIEASSSVEVIEGIIRAYFEFPLKNPEFVRLLLWENLNNGAHLEAEIAEELSKSPILEFLQKAMNEGVAEGRIRPGLNAKHLLIQMIGLCLIYSSNRYTLTKTVNLDLTSPKVLKQGADQVVLMVKSGILIEKAERQG
ncbi:MAG: TetR/AcrR family transcriptional regulator [Verrucomicrobiota bacterium]